MCERAYRCIALMFVYFNTVLFTTADILNMTKQKESSAICARHTCLASAGSEGAVPVWSKGPVLRAYSAERARVFTQ